MWNFGSSNTHGVATAEGHARFLRLEGGQKAAAGDPAGGRCPHWAAGNRQDAGKRLVSSIGTEPTANSQKIKTPQMLACFTQCNCWTNAEQTTLGNLSSVKTHANAPGRLDQFCSVQDTVTYLFALEQAKQKRPTVSFCGSHPITPCSSAVPGDSRPASHVPRWCWPGPTRAQFRPYPGFRLPF